MSPTVEQMLKNANVAEGMTLTQIRKLVHNSGVDTNAATAQAAEIEEQFLADKSREVLIAVFLSGLMANLIDYTPHEVTNGSD